MGKTICSFFSFLTEAVILWQYAVFFNILRWRPSHPVLILWVACSFKTKKTRVVVVQEHCM